MHGHLNVKWIIFLHSIELLAILMEKLYVFCEIRTEALLIILIQFSFQRWHALRLKCEGLTKSNITRQAMYV